MLNKNLTISLPFPPNELSPNARVFRLKKNKIFQAYKKVAYEQTLLAIGDTDKPSPCDRYCKRTVVNIQYTVTPPDRRARDEDNFFARMKAAQDGIALAMGVDDAHFHLKEIIHVTEPVKGGKVDVEIQWRES